MMNGRCTGEMRAKLSFDICYRFFLLIGLLMVGASLPCKNLQASSKENNGNSNSNAYLPIESFSGGLLSILDGQRRFSCSAGSFAGADSQTSKRGRKSINPDHAITIQLPACMKDAGEDAVIDFLKTFLPVGKSGFQHPNDIAISIDVTGSQFGDKALEFVANFFPNTTHLSLGNCKNITDQGLLQLVKLRSLKRLVLFGGSQVTGSSFASLPDSVTELILAYTSVVDQNLLNLRHLNRLRVLDLSNNKKISGESLEQLALDLSKLEWLDLSSTSLTDPAKLSGYRKLIKLDLSDNDLVVSHLDQLSPTLRDVGLSYVPIDDQVLGQLLEHLPRLEALDISRNLKITGVTLNQAPLTLKRVNLAETSAASEFIGQLRDSRPSLDIREPEKEIE